MRTVEDVAVIDHQGEKSDAERMPLKCGNVLPQAGTEKDRLARIGVSGPFVENKHSEELIPILDAVEEGIRHEIVDGDAIRIARIS